MNTLFMVKNIILIIGWPILIAGGIYLYIEGKNVFKLIKGSLVGKVMNVLIYNMVTGMISLGIVSTALMFYDINGVYVVIPIFIIWLIMYIWTIKVLLKAEKEAKELMGEVK